MNLLKGHVNGCRKLIHICMIGRNEKQGTKSGNSSQSLFIVHVLNMLFCSRLDFLQDKELSVLCALWSLRSFLFRALNRHRAWATRLGVYSELAENRVTSGTRTSQWSIEKKAEGGWREMKHVKKIYGWTKKHKTKNIFNEFAMLFCELLKCTRAYILESLVYRKNVQSTNYVEMGQTSLEEQKDWVK